MELPREDLLRYRRRGDYQGHAVALARTRDDDDAYVKLSTRDQRLKRDLVGLKKKMFEADWIQRLEQYLREPGGQTTERYAEVCEIAHLRDLLSALDPVDAPAFGDLPAGGGSLTSKCSAVAAYDLLLLDGVVGWIGDDAELQAKPRDIKTQGKASVLSRNTIVRGFRLWEFRNLLMGDYGAKGAGKASSEPPWAPLHGVEQETGDWYTWANKEMGKEKILSRVAAMADWSRTPCSFQNSRILRGDDPKERGRGIDEDCLRGALAERPHDYWTREKLREHWRVLKGEAVQLLAQGDTVRSISAALHIHEKTIREWLPGNQGGQPQ